MNPELISISRLCFCALDTYMLLSFFQSMFSKRFGKKKQVFWYVTITFVIFLENALGNIQINLLIIPILYLLLAMVTYNITWKTGIVYTIIFYAIFAGGKEVAFELLFRLLSAWLPFHLEWTAENGVYFLTVEYLLGFLFLLYVERFTKRLEIHQDTGFEYYLLILPLSSMLVLGSFIYMDFPDSFMNQVLMCVGGFMMYFSNAAVFIILAALTTEMNRIKNDELYYMRQSMEDEKYKNIAALNEQYSNFMHDVHKYFNNIGMLAMKGKSQEIIDIIEQLEGKMDEDIADVFYSDNEVLNSVLKERKSKAQNMDIDLTIFVENFLNVDFIKAADIISMFGNLLDNALEAASRCEEGKRKIDVKLFMGTRYVLVFYIDNYFAVPITKAGNYILSTKESKDPHEHGQGIGIVKRLAEQYGGTLGIEEKDDHFITTLTLSAYQGK